MPQTIDKQYQHLFLKTDSDELKLLASAASTFVCIS
jgi:hypothetical protein